MEDIAIIGAGGLGREILSLLMAINQTKPTYNIIGFYDDKAEKGTMIYNFPILGKIEDLKLISSPIAVTIAIGSPQAKRKIIEKINKNHYISYPSLIHPKAYIQNPETIKIANGVTIAAGAVITCDITIDKFVFLNLNCTVGHDAKIGPYSSFMPTVNISGETVIGECVYVGTGATIINKIGIGDNAIIGAGSTVISNIPTNTTVVGTPAKVVKHNENKQDE
ncbi:acetyltransferase [Porphyromonas gulae]|uniref:acetyltransferase n=1 Tax=Porphyromonas gulae TaxID=111105 RepID=UPI00052C8E16|nr:acetyltransferase [Porphyromonas gulae]KGN74581.1 acetyltransferase [Porphyromonas gulae]KGO04749.1 acetyltransferase [Porphyromonas gulae]